MKQSLILLIFAYAGYLPVAFGQEITGRVTNGATGEPIPYANVYYTGTNIGTTTNFEGYFYLSDANSYDSLSVSYMGFKSEKKPLVNNSEYYFQLEEDILNLKEFDFYAGENPAHEILRKVIRNKPLNDKRSLKAYQYESYTKIEIDIDNLSDKFRNRRPVRKITAVMDSIEVIAGENGKPLLPILFSEAISNYYFRNNPILKKEVMVKTKVSGVAITDGTLTSQFIGSTFQEYNFYTNWVDMVNKKFISPIADGWKGYYEYDLMDSLAIGDDFCYKIDFFPKRQGDLAFSGTMWITVDGYALKQLDFTVDKEANLNYIEKIKIQQELVETSQGPWIPSKTRVLIDVGEVTDQSASLLAKFYISNTDIIADEPKPVDFYKSMITMEDEVTENDEEFWKNNRHDPLTDTEVNVFRMIDTVKQIPSVKLATGGAKWAYNGYLPVGKLDLGPYTTWYSNNNVEGFRIGFGARTNVKFSNKWVFEGYGAYGFDDERWKYHGALKYIISREPWTTIKYQHKLEIDPIWILNDEVNSQSLFYAYGRFGRLYDPFLHRSNTLDFEIQTGPGWINRVMIKQQEFSPEFDFQYNVDPGSSDPVLASDFSTTEINLETRYAKDEIWVINDNERFSMGTILSPVFIMRYTLGLKNVLGSDFSYHKLTAEIRKNQKVGVFGKSFFSISGGYIFNDLPYPLLKAHIGNETPFYISFTSNLMNFYEFSSDSWAYFRWRHQFEGLIMNRVPLMRRLNLRLTATADIISGGMRQSNLDLVVSRYDTEGNLITPFSHFDNRPYVELGYGIENIFKILRIDFFHRLTYTDLPNVRGFGIKGSFQFIL